MPTSTEYCPRCKEDVEVALPWDKVVCPKCGLEGRYEEDCLPDYSDCWIYVDWDMF